ncbi:hypothetical protein K438DRAFT_2030361 [Mycena galopus ATCC 62051]|nr:hypothetical protein K438DRAFT_2030361 [Mycena galopus ATCC 62051]
MNGRLTRARLNYLSNLPRYPLTCLTRWPLLLRRDFAQTCIPANNEKPSRIRLSNTLSSSHSNGPSGPSLIRRDVLVSNIPPGTTAQQILNLVRIGPLEYIEMIEDGTSAKLSFLHGYSAARFIATSVSLAIAGHELHSTWLPYRPLDPIVATAVEKDRAQRTLLLWKKRDRQDSWNAAPLTRYLGGEVEMVTVRKLELGRSDEPTIADRYCEVAIVHFLDLSGAIRAHARLRADPFMMSVHIMYGTDRCDLPSHDDVDVEIAALEHELPHRPTYFPVTGDAEKIYRPFTTVRLSNLHPQTSTRDLIKRIFGGTLYSVDLDAASGTANVSFFRAEDARDFYAGAQSGGFTLHGNRIRLEPHPEAGIVNEAEERVLPHDDAYTRVLCLQAFDAPTEPLMRRRNKIAADFWTFGPLDCVTTNNFRPDARQLYVAFACAADALRAQQHITTAHPTYLAYSITFARDPCARGVPAADEWALDRVLKSASPAAPDAALPLLRASVERGKGDAAAKRTTDPSKWDPALWSRYYQERNSVQGIEVKEDGRWREKRRRRTNNKWARVRQTQAQALTLALAGIRPAAAQPKGAGAREGRVVAGRN